MAGFSNETVYGKNVDFSGAAQVTPQVTADGELLIGNAATPNIRVGTLTSPDSSITIGYSDPDITLQVTGGDTAIDSIQVDSATAPGTDPVVPDVNGVITVTGAQVATGVVGTNVIRTHSTAANSYTIEVQRSTENGGSNVALNGVCHFSSTDFVVDANGFVELAAAFSFAWTEITDIVGSLVAQNGYVANNGALVTLTMPVAAAFGTIIRVAGKGAGGWLIAQNAGQSIRFGLLTTSVGVGGSLASTDDADCVELLCITANTTWLVLSSVGVLTVT